MQHQPYKVLRSLRCQHIYTFHLLITYTTRTLFDVGQSPKAYDAALLPPYISSQRHKNSYMLQQCSLDPEIEDFYLDQHVLHVCERV